MLSASNKKKLRSFQLNSMSKDWKGKLKTILKDVKKSSLLVFNTVLTESDWKKAEYGKEIAKLLADQKGSIDFLLLAQDMEFASENERSDFICLERFEGSSPWRFHRTQTLQQELPKKLKNVSTHEWTLPQFDFASLLCAVIANDSLDMNDPDFITKLDSGIARYDGKSDIFIGERHTWNFKNRRNTESESYLVKTPAHLKGFENKEKRTKILHYQQPQKLDGRIIEVPVHFCYLDVLNIVFVDISQGVWGVEFRFEFITKNTEGIDAINFKNLSNINPLLRITQITKTVPDEHGYISFVYEITGNFSFEADGKSFPFDIQDTYIEYTLKDHKSGILQPVPEGQLDYVFNVNGWELITPYSVMQRTKEFLKTGRVF